MSIIKLIDPVPSPPPSWDAGGRSNDSGYMDRYIDTLRRPTTRRNSRALAASGAEEVEEADMAILLTAREIAVWVWRAWIKVHAEAVA